MAWPVRMHPETLPRGRGAIRVKAHGSVLHAKFRVGLAPAGEPASEERLEAEFEVAHFHDSVDRTLA